MAAGGEAAPRRRAGGEVMPHPTLIDVLRGEVAGLKGERRVDTANILSLSESLGKQIERVGDLEADNERLHRWVVRLGGVVDTTRTEHMNQAIRNGTSGCICGWCLDASSALLGEKGKDDG